MEGSGAKVSSLKVTKKWDFGSFFPCTGLGKRVVPRLRELVLHGQRESGGRIHAT